MTQGYPLAIITYSIRILPLISELCTAHTHAMQPRYEVNTGMGGTFEAFHDHMRYLLVRGPQQGYFLEPTKSILVVSLFNSQYAESHSWVMDIWVVTGSFHLVSFIIDQDLDNSLLAEKVEGYTHLVEVLDGVALRHPHTSYSGL